jgi:hypothetical protein
MDVKLQQANPFDFGEGYEKEYADSLDDIKNNAQYRTRGLREQAFYHGCHWAMRRQHWQSPYVLKTDGTPNEVHPYWLGRRVAYFVQSQ